MITYLNEILDEGLELHPLQSQRETARDLRQIGGGIMGLADCFIKLGIRYGSEDSLRISNEIGSVMINSALQQSALLAKDFGTFPKYKADKVLQSDFLKTVATQETFDLIEKYGLRNSQVLTAAPTGSIATMLGCSNGIEPLFNISYTRKTESLHDEAVYYKVFTPVVKEYMDFHNILDEKDLPDFFNTAMTLNYKERIDMLVQHYEILKQDTNPRKALLDIKTHALAYLKYIPNTKELKQKIASSKTEEEFNNCINELYNHIKCINCENNKNTDNSL